jgi:hypothetical protein
MSSTFPRVGELKRKSNIGSALEAHIKSLPLDRRRIETNWTFGLTFRTPHCIKKPSNRHSGSVCVIAIQFALGRVEDLKLLMRNQTILPSAPLLKAHRRAASLRYPRPSQGIERNQRRAGTHRRQGMKVVTLFMEP